MRASVKLKRERACARGAGTAVGHGGRGSNNFLMSRMLFVVATQYSPSSDWSVWVWRFTVVVVVVVVVFVAMAMGSRGFVVKTPLIPRDEQTLNFKIAFTAGWALASGC
jgi:hypothetical protein